MPSLTTETTSRTSPRPQVNATMAAGRWCFNCDGMTHLQYCNEVVRCQSETEVCYVQSYTNFNHHAKLYRSGCMDIQQCRGGTGGNSCTECCNGNFCNHAGCGDSGLPDIGMRGPLCFDCAYIGHTETCNSVKLCHHDQLCKQSDSVRSVRSLPVCTQCCPTDFCNMNCTAETSPPAFVG